MPLARADERVLRALANLEHDADFATVVDWLEQSKTSTVEALGVQADDVKLRWAQADLALLADILRIVKAAKVKLQAKAVTRPMAPFTG